MTGAVLRSETKSLVRSKSGAFIRGSEPLEAVGHIILTGANEGPIAFDATTGAYRILGTNLNNVRKVCWAGGQLFGYDPNFWQVFVFNPSTSQWDAAGDPLPLGPIRDLIAHNDEAYVASGSTVFRWTGSTWAEHVRYDADQIRVENLAQSSTILCNTIPIAQCIPLRSQLEVLTSTEPAYIGTWDVEQLDQFSPRAVGVRLPFVATASGTMRTEHSAIENYSSVSDGIGEIIFFNGDTGASALDAGAPYPQALVSQNNQLYLAGFGWESTLPQNDHLNCHPIIRDDGAVIAVLRRPIDFMVPGYFGAFLFKLGDQPVLEWRDTYPGCCLRLPNVVEPGDHFQWNTSTANGWWHACQANSVFDPDNVFNPFEAGGDQPDITWIYLYANVIYAAIKWYDGQLRMTFEEPHGYSVGSQFTMDDESRWNGRFSVDEVLGPRDIRIDFEDYRGDARVGVWDGITFPTGSPDRYISQITKHAGRFHGLYRWAPSTSTWEDAIVDRNWAEGLPGAHPLITTGGPAWYSDADHGLTVSADGVAYMITKDEFSGGSVEGAVGGILFRLCFPGLTFPVTPQQPKNEAERLYALPRGAFIPDLTSSCPGTGVTVSSSGSSNTLNLTCDSAHGLTGADQIEILTSTVPGYLGTKNLAEIISSTELRVRDTFEGNANGTWAEVGNPSNSGTFSTVTDGGVWSYWYTYIELGLDVRPSDLRITGVTSGLVADFGGIPFDYRKREIVPGGVRGQHEARYNRLGQTDGPGTTHFYRLEYPQATDPGWIIGEDVTISRV